MEGFDELLKDEWDGDVGHSSDSESPDERVGIVRVLSVVVCGLE